jgi:hypothetical protein
MGRRLIWRGNDQVMQLSSYLGFRNNAGIWSGAPSVGSAFYVNYATTERSIFPSNEYAGFSRIETQPIRETSIPCYACEDRRCFAFLPTSMLENESVLPAPNHHVWLLVPLHNLFQVAQFERQDGGRC